MKKNSSIAIIILSILNFSSKAQNLPPNRISNTGRVTKVEVFVSPGYAQNCNQEAKLFTFTALIQTNGACNIRYKWNRSDGAIDNTPNRSLSIPRAGIYKVTTTWTLSRNNFSGWHNIEVTSPNSIVSNKAVLEINCCD